MTQVADRGELFLSPEERETLRWLGRMPFASAQDVSAIGVMSKARVYKALPHWDEAGLVSHIDVGMTMAKRKRWYLTRHGVRQVFAMDHQHADARIERHLDRLDLPLEEWEAITERYAWDHTHTYQPAQHWNGRRNEMAEDLGHEHVPWSATPAGLLTLLTRMPMLEQTYAQVPTLLRSDEAELDSEGLTDRRLSDFGWLRNSSAVHAVARYGPHIWIPCVWVGMEVSRNVLEKRWKRPFRGLRHYSAEEDSYDSYNRHDIYGLDEPEPERAPDPSGWLVIAMDVRAMMIARQVISPRAAPYRKCVIVDSGKVIEEGTIRSSNDFAWDPPQLAALGFPEGIEESVEEDKAFQAINGKLAFRTFVAVEQWPAMRVGQLANLVKESNRKTKEVLESLATAGLATELEGRYYLADGGMLCAARRDRISVKTIRNRFGTYLDETSRYRRRNVRHNSGVNKLAVACAREKVDVAAGWRGVLNVAKATQLAPDILILVDSDLFDWGWHYVEYERSATTVKHIQRKLRPYRLLAENKVLWPLILVVDKADAEAVFVRACPELPMITSTLGRVVQGPVSGEPAAVWRFKEEPVVIW